MKFRRSLRITSRTSSVTNGFVQAIIPGIEPTDEEIDAALAMLGMTRDSIECRPADDATSPGAAPIGEPG